MSRPAITPTDQGKPLPPANPSYEVAKPALVRIGKRECVEVCGSKWPELLQTAEILTKGAKP